MNSDFTVRPDRSDKSATNVKFVVLFLNFPDQGLSKILRNLKLYLASFLRK